MINGFVINGAAINASAAGAGAGAPVSVWGTHASDIALPAQNPIWATHSTTWQAPIWAGHSSLLPNAVWANHSSACVLLTPTWNEHSSQLVIAEHNSVEASFSYDCGFYLEAVFAQPCLIEQPVEVVFTQTCHVVTPLEKVWAVDCTLPATTTLERAWTYVLNVVDDGAVVSTSTATLMKNGVAIELSDSLTLDIEEGDYAWKAQVVLANTGDGDLFAYNDEVILAAFGVDYTLLVDSKSTQRPGPDGSSVSIELIGPGARFAAPRAALMTANYEEDRTAKTIVEDLLGVVDWRIADWVIPANRLAASDASPMVIAQRIVAATGAVLEPLPDGSLYVRYRYPVAVANYETTVPDAVIYEADSVFTRAQPYRFFERVDRLRITDISDVEASASADAIEFTAGELSGLAGQLDVYPNPWRDVHVRHTGVGGVVLSPLGDLSLEKSQQVEIIDGKATLAHGVQSLVSVEWESVPLGALSYTVDGKELLVDAGELQGVAGLATVTYKTRAQSWFCSATENDDVQFLVIDGVA